MMLRKIEEKDNSKIAEVIRKNLEMNNLAIPGTSYTDPQLDDLYHYYKNTDKGEYWVIEEDGQVVGGAGFNSIPGYPNIAELQKIYVSIECHGKGLGSLLMERIIERATKAGYNFLYLETSANLSAALPFYKKFDFKFLNQALDSPASHYAMTIWMIRSLGLAGSDYTKIQE